MGADQSTEIFFPRAGRKEVILSYLLKAVLMLAAIYALISQNYFLIFSAIIAIAASLMPAVFERQWHLILPIELELVITGFITTHLIFGEIGGFYAKYWWFDLLLHTSSGFIFGIIGFVWAYMFFYTNRVKAQPVFIVAFAVSLAIAAGAVWEIFEFSMDQFFGFNMQKSGLVDTMGDLLVCLIASLVVGMVGFSYLRTHRGGFVRRIIMRGDQYRARIDEASDQRSA